MAIWISMACWSKKKSGYVFFSKLILVVGRILWFDSIYKESYAISGPCIVYVPKGVVKPP